MKGRVIKFDPARGFGFIASRDHDGDLFFHIRDVKNADTLRAGQSVSFDLRMTKKGPAAVAVIAGRRHLSPFFFYAAIATVSVVVLAVYFGRKGAPLLAYLAAVNLITIMMYGYDKAVAGTDRVRVPELLLHLLALLGGSPAALLAQRLFRHKTRKAPFQLVFWLTVALQAFVLWLFWYR